MSVYNGFNDNSFEHAYNNALFNAIFLLQLKVAKVFSRGRCSPTGGDAV